MSHNDLNKSGLRKLLQKLFQSMPSWQLEELAFTDVYMVLNILLLRWD